MTPSSQKNNYYHSVPDGITVTFSPFRDDYTKVHLQSDLTGKSFTLTKKQWMDKGIRKVYMNNISIQTYGAPTPQRASEMQNKKWNNRDKFRREYLQTIGYRVTHNYDPTDTTIISATITDIVSDQFITMPYHHYCNLSYRQNSMADFIDIGRNPDDYLNLNISPKDFSASVRHDPPTPAYPTWGGINAALDATEELSGVYDPKSSDYSPLFPWGEVSRRNLKTLDVELVHCCNLVADVMNISITSGYRGELEQTAYFKKGTGVEWPTSKHNDLPSQAVDVNPYPINYEDTNRYCEMIGMFLMAACEHGYKIRSGRHFNRRDYPHIERIQ